MRRRRAFLVPSATLFAVCGLPVNAATSAWLDFGGAIRGESVAQGHENWIDIIGYGFDVHRGISLPESGHTAYRAQLAEFTLTKFLDRSSPTLFVAAATGKTPYEMVRLDLNVRETQPLVRVELENVFVTGQALAAFEGSDRPSESISLSFSKISYTYITPGSQLYTEYDLVSDAAKSNAGVVLPPDPDRDGDGMADSWELAYGLNVEANDAASDADGDGLSNLDEFQLGTNPKSGTSFFKATLAKSPKDPESYELGWNSVVGKTYIIEWTPDLGSPFTTVRTVTSTSTTSAETFAPKGSVGFYRVRPQ